MIENFSTCARYPPIAGPMIRPIAHAVLTYSHRKSRFTTQMVALKFMSKAFLYHLQLRVIIQ